MLRFNHQVLIATQISHGEVELRIIGEDKLTVAGVDNLLGINVITDSQCFSSGNI